MLTIISLLIGFYFVLFILSLIGVTHFRIGTSPHPPRLDFHICPGCTNMILIWLVLECSWGHLLGMKEE